MRLWDSLSVSAAVADPGGRCGNGVLAAEVQGHMGSERGKHAENVLGRRIQVFMLGIDK